MAISKVQLLNQTNAAGSYQLANITVDIDGRISVAASAQSINFTGTGAGDGDIQSAGGHDGRFGIYNTASGGTIALSAVTGTTVKDRIVIDPSTSSCYGFPFTIPASPGSTNGFVYIPGDLLLGDANNPSGEIVSTGGDDGQFGIFNYSENPNNPATSNSRSIAFFTKTYPGTSLQGRFVINEFGSTSLASLGYLNQLVGVGGGSLGSSDMVVDGGSDGVFVIFNGSTVAGRMISFAINNEALNGPEALLRCYRDGAIGGYFVDCPAPGTVFSVNGLKPFRIAHPIDEEKDLVHVAIEGPRADLLYRGTVKLSNGVATVNLDEEYGLIAGTWAALCRNPQVWVTSVDGWEPCKGSVSGEILTINAKDQTCEETVSWLVVAERQDAAMYSPASDENGRPILEPDRRPSSEPHPIPNLESISSLRG